MEQHPYAWYEHHGQETWDEFLKLIRPKRNCLSRLLRIDNNPQFAKHLSLLIKKLATQSSTVKPGYSILDALAIPTLETITMQELEDLQHLTVNARVIARNLLITKHLSEKLKNQYKEVITKFANDFSIFDYYNPKEEQQ